MIGPFKPAPGGFHWVYVIIDKFFKWIEYKPLVKVTAKKAAELLDDIIQWIGLPNCIITDLGSTCTGNDFWNFCDDRGIVVKYVSVAHPKANMQVKRANGMILDTLKKRLYRENDKHLGRWLKELPTMVRGLRLNPVGIRVSPRTSWFLAQKLCYQPISLSDLPGSKTMMKRKLTKPKSLKLIAPRSSVLSLVYGRLNT
jgi:hypothetical protein